MTLLEFEEQLGVVLDDAALTTFCQQHMLHGTPFVFGGRDQDYFSFKKRISDHYDINPAEIFVVGSGKLGFSPLKKTDFSVESDIDLAIVSPVLARQVDELGLKLEYSLRASETFLTETQKNSYFRYLRYKAIGWTRPDLIPHKAPIRDFKSAWFDFFNSLSHGRSEVGNYKVTAGLFRSLPHLEEYTKDSLRKIKRKLEVEAHQ